MTHLKKQQQLVLPETLSLLWIIQVSLPTVFFMGCSMVGRHFNKETDMQKLSTQNSFLARCHRRQVRQSLICNWDEHNLQGGHGLRIAAGTFTFYVHACGFVCLQESICNITCRFLRGFLKPGFVYHCGSTTA